jgi:Hsp70 protein
VTRPSGRGINLVAATGNRKVYLMVNQLQVPADSKQLAMTNNFPRKHNSIILLALVSFLFVIAHAGLNHPGTGGTATSAYGTVIGIDLGTTYTCIAIHKNDTVHVLVNDQGELNTPSWVSFSGDGKTWCVMRSSFIPCGP